MQTFHCNKIDNANIYRQTSNERTQIESFNSQIDLAKYNKNQSQQNRFRKTLISFDFRWSQRLIFNLFLIQKMVREMNKKPFALLIVMTAFRAVPCRARFVFVITFYVCNVFSLYIEWREHLSIQHNETIERERDSGKVKNNASLEKLSKRFNEMNHTCGKCSALL